MRYEFGVSGPEGRDVHERAEGRRVDVRRGAMVLSRDGARISLGLDIPAPLLYKVFDVASKGSSSIGARTRRELLLRLAGQRADPWSRTA